jgi:hypothetical protein
MLIVVSLVVVVPLAQEDLNATLSWFKRARHNWLKSWQKSIGHADFGCAAALELGPIP